MTASPPPAAVGRPAVFQVSLIGDQLAALPAFRAIATLFPAPLQLLLGEGMLSFFYRGLPVSDPVRVWWNDYESGRVERIAGAAQPCDVFVCLSRHATRFVADLALRMGASRSIGLSAVFDQHVQVDPDSHIFDQLFAIPQAIDPTLRLESFCAPPTFSPAAQDAAARLVATARSRGTRILFLHPETKPEKRWGSDRFAWVLERFLAERPDYLVFISSLAPLDFSVHSNRVMHIDLHLELTMAIVEHADLFLGIDSCFLHAADLFRVPGVALFGPTRADEWGFHLSPAYRHVSETSMDRIRPEAVLGALLDLAHVVDTMSPDQ